jgi:hypothetical protein
MVCIHWIIDCVGGLVTKVMGREGLTVQKSDLIPFMAKPHTKAIHLVKLVKSALIIVNVKLLQSTEEQ